MARDGERRQQPSTGRFATGSRHFGSSSVSGKSRDPSVPAPPTVGWPGGGRCRSPACGSSAVELAGSISVGVYPTLHRTPSVPWKIPPRGQLAAPALFGLLVRALARLHARVYYSATVPEPATPRAVPEPYGWKAIHSQITSSTEQTCR